VIGIIPEWAVEKFASLPDELAIPLKQCMVLASVWLCAIIAATR